MGSVEFSIPFRGGDLVFIAEKDDNHAYTCMCKTCNGMGTVERPRGVKTVPIDEEEGDYLYEDELECPDCNGYGGQDEEAVVLFPSAIGRISRILADHVVDLRPDADDDGEEEEVIVSVNLLTTANIDAISLMGQTEQMIEFYRRLKAGTVTDFINTDRSDIREVPVENVHRSYKQSCEFVLKANLATFRQVHDDLTNPEMEITDVERVDLIHVCNEIVAVQDMILAIYPELGKLLPGHKSKSKSEKTTDKVDKPPKKEAANNALMALSEVEVEEVLL